MPLVEQKHTISHKKVSTVMVFKGQHDSDSLWILVFNNIVVQLHVTVLAQM